MNDQKAATLEERVKAAMEDFAIEISTLLRKKKVGEVVVTARVVPDGVKYITVAVNKESRH